MSVLNSFFLFCLCRLFSFFFFFNDTATTEIYTLSLHDALPISGANGCLNSCREKLSRKSWNSLRTSRSEEHTSELQSPDHLVCRLLLEKKKDKDNGEPSITSAMPQHSTLTNHPHRRAESGERHR